LASPSSGEHITNTDGATDRGLSTDASFRRNEEPLRQEHLHTSTGTGRERGERCIENAWLPRGFYMGQLGGAASRIFVNVAALRPAGGGTQGDIVFNKNAAVGQPMGWVYDGTQWRDLPNIT